ncbi:hypothetical protein L1987_87144 [Smallanthus sonchifolius]|nr:hypothetical protein L1987_87144 [Smallanthus sonchifolius]
MVAKSQFVAVEFDTYWNSWDPKVWNATVGENVSVGDHVGISISNLTSVRSEKWFSNITGGGECQAWITYDSVSNNLSVSFTGYRNNISFRQDELVYTVDLRKELPEWVIFGFSAATGASFQKNNVRSWSFNSSDLQVDENNGIPPQPAPDLVSPGPNPVIKPGPDPVNEKNSTVGLIVGLLVAIIFVSMLAFVLWWRRKKISWNKWCYA